jgi:nucleotidyltransferase/DNA polymerase involved in DNA repair
LSSGARAKNYPCRHGRVLCLNRATRQTGFEAKADDRRLERKALSGMRGLLRGQSFRSTLRHACCSRTTIVSGCDLHSPDFTRYRAVSRDVHAILGRHTDNIEPLSLDEAYLDVTENKLGLPTAALVARRIREQIRDELNLTASAGVAPINFSPSWLRIGASPMVCLSVSLKRSSHFSCLCR